MAEDARPARGFRQGLEGNGLAAIAEIKRRSPSRGDIDQGLVPEKLALAYVEGGASAISILTEQDHFSGHPDDLRQVRAAVDLPLLRKDFILHPAQIWESRAMGADAVLLIVAVLDESVLRLLLEEAAAAGLEALVEVHTAAEARVAVDIGADLIGVNNRDLGTFEVDLATSERLFELLPEGAIKVAESGVSSVEGASRMAAAGFDAILVGEAAVRSSDPAAFVRALVESS